jgi:hypothetical protein
MLFELIHVVVHDRDFAAVKPLIEKGAAFQQAAIVDQGAGFIV